MISEGYGGRSSRYYAPICLDGVLTTDAEDDEDAEPERHPPKLIRTPFGVRNFYGSDYWGAA